MITAYDNLLGLLNSSREYDNYYIMHSQEAPYTYSVFEYTEIGSNLLFVGNYRETKAFIKGLQTRRRDYEPVRNHYNGGV